MGDFNLPSLKGLAIINIPILSEAKGAKYKRNTPKNIRMTKKIPPKRN
jgi:hypothetical protein